MKLFSTDNVVESNGIAESGDFSIKTNAAAFQLLSSGLYSNKIKAVIRELSCNAVDAHVLNGNEDVPIEVKLPNDLDTQFYVKDFGPGMTHDQIMRLYTTYFDSTKRDSDDFIGGFGVGSKSPFAYTDSFTVESRQGGKVRTYTAYVDNGFPKIAFMAEEDTTELSGLTVRFPVKPTDFRRFESEAQEVFKWFKQKPTLLGVVGDIVEPEHIVLSPTVKLVKDSTSASVRMGNVVYPLSKFFDELPEDEPNREAFDWIRGRRIFLEAPIGSISVAASREELSYDKPTVATLRQMLTVGFELALKDVVDQVLKLDSALWDDRRKGYMLLHATGLNNVWTQKVFEENSRQPSPRSVPLLNRALAERGVSADVVVPFLFASQPLNWGDFKTFTVQAATSHHKVHQWEDLMSPGTSRFGRKMPEPNRVVAIFENDVPLKSVWAAKAWKGFTGKHLTAGIYGFVVTPNADVDQAEYATEKLALMKALGLTKELPSLSSGLTANELAALQGRSEKSVMVTTFFSGKSSRIYEGKPFYWLPAKNRFADATPHKPMTPDEAKAYQVLMALLEPNNNGNESDPALKAFLKLTGVPATRLYRVAPADFETVQSMKGAKSALDAFVAAIKKPETLSDIANMETELDIGERDSYENPFAALLYTSAYGEGERLSNASKGTKLGELVEKIKTLKRQQKESTSTKTLDLLNAVNDFAGNPVTIPQKVVKIDSVALFTKTYPMLRSFSKKAKSGDIEHMREYIQWCESKVKEDDLLVSTLNMLS